MKLVTPTILLAALASTSLPARAETPVRANMPILSTKAPQVVLISVLGKAEQALLQHRIRGDYVVVRVGETLGNYRVTRISVNQIVLSSTAEPTQHYILPRMPPAQIAGVSIPAAASSATRSTPVPRLAALAPINPYSSTAAPALRSTTVPTNPYATPTVVKTVIAPPAPTVVKTVIAPPGQRASEKPPVTRATATAAKPTARKSEPPRVENHAVRRSELQAAVADFGTLSKEVQMTRSGSHLAISGIARGSFFHRIGLRAGDIVRKVAGTKVKTLEDGATVYATIMTANAFDVLVKRGGRQITLRYRITE